MAKTKGDWAMLCVSQIMYAYAKGELDGGSIDWDHLDKAFESAKKAYSIPYKKYLKMLSDAEMGGN